MKPHPIPFGYIKEDKIYLASWGDNSERSIGEVRDNDQEKSIHFFELRFNELEIKVDEVVQKIEQNENKGSYLMKLIHLRDLLTHHDGLGDYAKLNEKIIKYENLIKDIIQKNRLRNTEIKNALLEESKQINDILNWKEATEKVNDLKARWIKTGAADEENNENLESAFWEIVSKFFERKKQFFEDKQKLTDRRIEQYKELVKKSEEIKSLYGKLRFEKVKELKEQWKEVGGVPAEFYKPLNNNFNFNLKSKPPRHNSFVNYAPIIDMLEEVKSGKIPYDKKELDIIKNNLLKDKKRSDQKFQVQALIQIINEKEFVTSLCNKRFPDYSKMDVEKKKSIKSNIIKDLINRDKEELKTYEENSANFSSSDGSLNRLVSGKIFGQKKKIKLKEQLLEMIKNGEF